jgi:hypothetical protein
MATVSYGFSIQVTGGPQISNTKLATVEAYDKVEVKLDPGATDVVVDVQPGATGQIALLAISSSLYSPKITYKVADGGGDKGPFALDAPHFFSGGAVGVFGAAPKTLKFSNALPTGAANKAAIEIFVARDATP